MIALNVIVFVSYLPLLNDEARLIAFFDRWALVPAELVARHDIYTLLTSMFLHADWLHLMEGERLLRCTRGRVVVRDREGLIRLAGAAYGGVRGELAAARIATLAAPSPAQP